MGLYGRKEPQHGAPRRPEGRQAHPASAGCGTDVDRSVGQGGDDPVAGGRMGPGTTGVERGGFETKPALAPRSPRAEENTPFLPHCGKHPQSISVPLF